MSTVPPNAPKKAQTDSVLIQQKDLDFLRELYCRTFIRGRTLERTLTHRRYHTPNQPTRNNKPPNIKQTRYEKKNERQFASPERSTDSKPPDAPRKKHRTD